MGQEASTENTSVPEDVTATSDRPLPEEPFSAQALAIFKCPFEEMTASPKCTRSDCPFTHGRTYQDEDKELVRTLPWYFCLDRLLGQCESTEIQRLGDSLVRCQFGFHPSEGDLTDASSFTRQMAEAVLGGFHSTLAVSASLACDCQLPYTAPFIGLPERCSHVICANCCLELNKRLRKKEDPKMNLHCTLCGTVSHRLLFWPTANVSRAYREFLFANQKKAFGLLVAPEVRVALRQVPHSQDIVLTYKGFFGRATVP